MNEQNLKELERRVATTERPQLAPRRFQLLPKEGARLDRDNGVYNLWDVRLNVYTFPPQLRTVNLSDLGRHFTLQLPTSIFIAAHAHIINSAHNPGHSSSYLFAYWSKSGLLDDLLYNPLFPNIYRQGNVCLGSDSLKYDMDDFSIIRLFWHAPFKSEGRGSWPGWNLMVDGSFLDRCRHHIGDWPTLSYEKWQEDSNFAQDAMSKMNPVVWKQEAAKLFGTDRHGTCQHELKELQ